MCSPFNCVERRLIVVMGLVSLVLAACISIGISTGLYIPAGRPEVGLHQVTLDTGHTASLVIRRHSEFVAHPSTPDRGALVGRTTADDAPDLDGGDEAARVWREHLDAANAPKKAQRRLERARSRTTDAVPVLQKEVSQLQAIHNEQPSRWKQARQGPRLVRRAVYKDLDALLEDPEVVRIANMGHHSREEVASYKRQLLDATGALDRVRRTRPTSDQEKARLRALRDAFNELNMIWRNLKEGKPPDTPRSQGNTPRELTDLTRDPDVLAAAELGGRPVEEVAAVKRHYLDSRNTMRNVEVELAEAQARGDDQSTRQDIEVRLRRARDLFNRRTRAWNRIQRVPAPRRGRARKDLATVMKDRDVVEVAERSGRPVEEVAATKKLYNDIRADVRDLQTELAETKKTGDAPIIREVERRLREAMDTFNKRQIAWNRVRKDKIPRRRRPRKDVAALRGDADVIAAAERTQRPVDEVAATKQQYLDAKAEMERIKTDLAKARKRRDVPATQDLEARLRQAMDEFNKRYSTWAKVRGGRGRLENLPDPDPDLGDADPLQRLHDQSARRDKAREQLQRASGEVQQVRTALDQARARLRQAEREVELCTAEVECHEKDLRAHEKSLEQAQRELQAAEQGFVRAAEDVVKKGPPASSPDAPSSSSSTQGDTNKPPARKGPQSSSFAISAPNPVDAGRQLSHKIQGVGRDLWTDGEALMNEVGRNLNQGFASYFARPKGRGFTRVRGRI